MHILQTQVRVCALFLCPGGVFQKNSVLQTWNSSASVSWIPVGITQASCLGPPWAASPRGRMTAPARSMAPPWGPGQHLMCEHAKSHKEVLATVKAIPGQVDGDPSQLAASGSHIFCASDPPGCRRLSRSGGFHRRTTAVGAWAAVGGSRLAGSTHNHDAQFKKVQLGGVLVLGDNDLEPLLSPHAEAPVGAQRSGSHILDQGPELAPRWYFLAATPVSHFYRIDLGQEPLSCVIEMAPEEACILEPEPWGPWPRMSSHFPSPHLTLPSYAPGTVRGGHHTPENDKLLEAAKRNDVCKTQTLHGAVGATGSCSPWSVPAARKGCAMCWTTPKPPHRPPKPWSWGGRRPVCTRWQPWTSTPAASTSWTAGEHPSWRQSSWGTQGGWEGSGHQAATSLGISSMTLWSTRRTGRRLWGCETSTGQ